MTALGKPASAAYQQGIYYLQTDRPYRALAAFRKMVSLAPERVDGPRWVSLALIKMKRLDLAASEAERGLERHPNQPELLGQLGRLYVLGRNRPKAEQLCKEWLKNDPNAAEPYRLLARIAREEQRLPEALRFDEQALARDPQNALVCGDLSRTLSALGGRENLHRAVELAQKATALNPREADYWLQLGEALRQRGDMAEAADALLRTLDLDPTTVSACSQLVEIATREHWPESARLYASLATQIQNNERVAGILWEATYRHPANVVARGHLVHAILASGDLRRAGFQLEELATSGAQNDARAVLARIRRIRDLQGD
jgi:tetratricopeptide (TPR) repeat protein